MKKVLLFTALDDEATFTADLAKAYKKGVVSAQGKAWEVNINRLQFVNMVDSSKVTLQSLEPDLKAVRNQILECDHLVFFVDINVGAFNFKLFSFLSRLFSLENALPSKALWAPSDFATKTARIVSILGAESWKTYKYTGRQIQNHPINKHALRLFGLNTVRTTSLGYVNKGVFNEYYYKWVHKMMQLGEKQY